MAPIKDDPDIIFSTYFGGSGEDFASCMAEGYSNEIYIAGQTQSTDLPVNRNLSGFFPGSQDIFIACFNPDVGNFTEITYFGGSGDENVKAIHFGEDGKIYISGSTSSTDFPVTPDAFQKSNSGKWDGYISVFDPKLEKLEFSSYIGGEEQDSIQDMVIDENNYAYITGVTDSSSYPVLKDSFQGKKSGKRDGFVSIIDLNKGEIIHSTFLGGASDDYGESLGIDEDKNVYITGYSYSSKTRSFPLKNELFGPSPFSYDAFITSFYSDLSDIKYSTYFGGDSGDRGTDICVLEDGDVYLTGYTYSDNFPVVNAFQNNFSGDKNSDAFIVRINSDCSEIIFSTYLGGTGNDFSNSISIGEDGLIYISGSTSSDDFPGVLNNPLIKDENSEVDAFLTIFLPDAKNIVSSKKFGGEKFDSALALVDMDSGVCIAGRTSSNNFYLENPNFNNNEDSYDAFLTIFPK
ncbi:SBBP repeat-containing protein [Methanochimaera problematica]|uniref:SBBP repeat-containing protein n=1 Tax=Methanochimaera problematica TaxID=2609417 RepID=UPI002938F094|nr:SBBP repeat-containing protein [Methanoplanus sp. FWC-SCC4]